MRAILIAFCLVLPGVPIQAWSTECDRNDETQSGMNACASSDYQVSDRKLNADYTELVNRLSDDPDALGKLRASQRAWVAFRDAECGFSSSGVEGGSIYPMIYAMCLQDLTDVRLRQLGSYLHCEEGDLSCPVPAQ